MSSQRWKIETLLEQADERRSAESFERQAHLLALLFIAVGADDPQNLARTALRLPLEHPGWEEVASALEGDDDLPF